eukprot:gnl/TRDRNA2_/TRDRNA2_90605_c0_seq1.p1 gnl/TRDRNA2_/TRDRNA2_90605_c0~~gnl/TRDRNA2_/TRDRNA2_90605_c0_seq1.p1  ORF type:complete len:108 (+),score=23.15 gnl/TRDRNA2_/TRDRNA2_90605_c0_seq1:182-505(+)
MTWALANVDHSNHKLFAMLATAAAWQIEELNSQDVDNVAWAFAKSGAKIKVKVSKLFAAIAFRAEQLLSVSALNHQNLAHMGWAFATAGRSDAALFQSLAWTAQWRT